MVNVPVVRILGRPSRITSVVARHCPARRIEPRILSSLISSLSYRPCLFFQRMTARFPSEFPPVPLTWSTRKLLFPTARPEREGMGNGRERILPRLKKRWTGKQEKQGRKKSFWSRINLCSFWQERWWVWISSQDGWEGGRREGERPAPGSKATLWTVSFFALDLFV
jgi:hypothetical protein